MENFCVSYTIGSSGSQFAFVTYSVNGTEVYSFNQLTASNIIGSIAAITHDGAGTGENIDE